MDNDVPSTSPCIGICRLDEATGFCAGCARTGEEIFGWGRYSPERLEQVWAELPDRRRRLGLGVHRLDWTAADLSTFVRETLTSGGGTWTCGIHGAVAEFSIAEDDRLSVAAEGAVLTATTPRGAIAFRLSGGLRALAIGTSPDAVEITVLALPRSGADGGSSRAGVVGTGLRRDRAGRSR